MTDHIILRGLDASNAKLQKISSNPSRYKLLNPKSLPNLILVTPKKGKKLCFNPNDLQPAQTLPASLLPFNRSALCHKTGRLLRHNSY